MDKSIITEIKKINAVDILHADNIQELSDAYANEVKSDGLPPISLDENMYIQLEEAGILDCLGVYHNNKLVGFASLATVIMPHYTEKSTTIESLFILKDYRAYGSANRLLDSIYSVSKNNGSKAIYLSAKIGSILDKTAQSLFGYEPTNIVYTRNI